MHRSKVLSALALLSAALLLAEPAQAGAGATGCDDLSGITPTPAVDFESQIQPILDGCANCHGASGPAGLDLRAGESYDNLVGVISNTNPGRLLVDPGAPGTSALFLAVNCDSPGGPGFRMPGADSQQAALIRDWIAQGAPPEAAGIPEPLAVPADAFWALLLLAALILGLGGGVLIRR
jgi:hypothetical protein